MALRQAQIKKESMEHVVIMPHLLNDNAAEAANLAVLGSRRGYHTAEWPGRTIKVEDLMEQIRQYRASRKKAIRTSAK